jgi:hypothetical protein
MNKNTRIHHRGTEGLFPIPHSSFLSPLSFLSPSPVGFYFKDKKRSKSIRPKIRDFRYKNSAIVLIKTLAGRCKMK